MRTQFGLAWVIALAVHVLAGLLLCLVQGRPERPVVVATNVATLFLTADPPPAPAVEVLSEPERAVIIDVPSEPLITGTPGSPSSAGTGPGSSAVARPAPASPPVPVGLTVFVLDRSGSMGANGQFAAARQLLLARLRQLPMGAEVAIVAFARQPQVILAPTVTSADALTNADAPLAELVAEGGTNPTAVARVLAAWHPARVVWLSDTPAPALTGCGNVQSITQFE